MWHAVVNVSHPSLLFKALHAHGILLHQRGCCERLAFVSLTRDPEKCSHKNHMFLLMFQTKNAVDLCKAGISSAAAARPCGRTSSTSPVPAATPSRKRKATSAPNPTRDVV